MKSLTFTALVAGLCLLALAAYLYPWAGRVDARAASLKLAQIPTSELRVKAESVTKFRIPDSEEWRKLITEWGAPKFIAAVESQSAKPELACFAQTGLNLRVTDLAGQTITTSPTGMAPYGYTSRCAITGLEFVASPGSEFLLHVTRLSSKAEDEGKLVIMPYWRYEKDRLVGNMIAPVFIQVSLGVGTVGICCLLVCLWSYRRQIATHRTA